MEEGKEWTVKNRKTQTSRLMYTTTEAEYSVPAENQKRPDENSRTEVLRFPSNARVVFAK